MSLLLNIKKSLKNPALIMAHMCRHWPFRMISDKSFMKLYYYAYHHKKIDLNNPKTFNEKLQWIKLYYRNPILTKLVDKYAVREYIKEKIGEEYLVDLLGVWDHPNEINYASLPDKFVLKCNHDSGSVIICRDKSIFDIAKANKKLGKCLRLNQFWKGREWAYLNVHRKIIAEEYLSDDNSDELTDYKFFCFDGNPMFVSTDRGRFSNHIRNYYTPEWDFIDASYGCKNDKDNLDPKPEKLEEMLAVARKLSEGFPHVRVDLYVANHHVYFGELTFSHGGGAMDLQPEYYDELWGNYLTLPQE